MIIKKEEEQKLINTSGVDGLWDAKLEGDKFRFTHAQNVLPMQELAYEMRKDDNNGFTEDRSMRLIGTIPALEFFKHPEWASNPEAIKKWLKSPAGAPYRTVRKGL